MQVRLHPLAGLEALRAFFFRAFLQRMPLGNYLRPARPPALSPFRRHGKDQRGAKTKLLIVATEIRLPTSAPDQISMRAGPVSEIEYVAGSDRVCL